MKDESESRSVSSFILHPSSFGLALVALAQLPQQLQRVNAGVVAVAPGDLVGVLADRRQADGAQRRQLAGLEDAERVRRLLALLAAGGAGAAVAQVRPGVAAAVAVVPLDDEVVVAFLAQSQRPQGLRAGSGHGGGFLLQSGSALII